MQIINHQITKVFLDAPVIDWIIIWTIFIILVLSHSTSNKHSQFHQLNNTTQLKGLAIWLLLVGHVSIHVLQQQTLLAKGGYWAVIIFLFFSGFGIASKYFHSRNSKQYWLRRISKIYPAVWVTTAVWIALSALHTYGTYETSEIIGAYLGLYKDDALYGINGAAWYVTMQLFWYAVFDLVRKWSKNKIISVLILAAVAIILFNWLSPHGIIIHSWVRYAFIFPLGVTVGLYQKQAQSFLTKTFKPIWLIPIFLFLFIFVKYEPSILFQLNQFPPFSNNLDINLDIWHLVSTTFYAVTLGIFWFASRKLRFNSWFLRVLGKYSYLIFLLHLPIMIKYDILLYRKPFWLYWWAYVFSIIVLSIVLNKALIHIQRQIDYQNK